MFRKVTRTGPSTLTTALPSKWAKEHNLKPGSFIEMNETDANITISATNQKNPENIKIQYDEVLIEDMLEKLFLEAESTITIESETIIPKSINNTVKKFPGFQIVEQQQKKVVINRTLSPSLSRPDSLMRRCYIIIKESLQENPPKFPEDLNELLFLLQLYRSSPKEVFILREIISTLSKIKKPVHDDAYSLLKIIFIAVQKQKFTFSNSETQRLNDIFDKIDGLFKTYFDSSRTPIEISALYHCSKLMDQLHKEIIRQQSLQVLAAKSEKKTKKKFVVGVCLKNQSNKFWAADVKGSMEESAKEEKNTEYIFDSPLVDHDIDEQDRILKKFIAEKVDGIILAPVEPKKLDKTVEQINKHNIPFLIFDTDLELENRKYTLICFDNYKGGFLTGTHLKKFLKKGSNILVIDGHLKGNFSNRAVGFKDALGSDFKITVLRGEFQESIAYEKALKFMKTQRVDAIFAVSDNMASGAIKACEELGRKIPICGFDRTDEGILAMEQGKLLSDVNTKPKEMGILAVQTMQNLLAKKTVAERIEYSIEFVTKK